MTFLNEDIIVISLLVLWWDSYIQPRSSNSPAFSSLHKVALLETDMWPTIQFASTVIDGIELFWKMWGCEDVFIIPVQPSKNYILRVSSNSLCDTSQVALYLYVIYILYSMALDCIICVIFHFWKNFRSLLCLLIALLLVIGDPVTFLVVCKDFDILITNGMY